MDQHEVLASGLVERIGETSGRVTYRGLVDGEEQKSTEETPMADHQRMKSWRLRSKAKGFC